MDRYALLLVASCVGVVYGQFCDDYCSQTQSCKRVPCDFTGTANCGTPANLAEGALTWSADDESCYCQADQTCKTPTAVDCPVSNCSMNANSTRNGVCYFWADYSELTGEICQRASDSAMGVCAGGYCIDGTELDYFNATELSVDFATDSDAQSVLEFPSDNNGTFILVLNPSRTTVRFAVPQGLDILCYGWNVSCATNAGILAMTFSIASSIQGDYAVFDVILGVRKTGSPTVLILEDVEIIFIVLPQSLTAPTSNSNTAKWRIGSTDYPTQSSSFPSVVSGTKVVLQNAYCQTGLATFVDENDHVLTFVNTTQYFGFLEIEARGYRYWSAYAVCTNLFSISAKSSVFFVNLTLVSNSDPSLTIDSFHSDIYHQMWLYAATNPSKVSNAEIAEFLDAATANLVGGIFNETLTVDDYSIQELIYISQFVSAGQKYLISYYANGVDCADDSVGDILENLQLLDMFQYQDWGTEFTTLYDQYIAGCGLDLGDGNVTAATQSVGFSTNAAPAPAKGVNSTVYFEGYKRTRTIMGSQVQADFNSKSSVVDGVSYPGFNRGTACASWCFVQNPTLQGVTSKQLCTLSSGERLSISYPTFTAVNRTVNATQGPVIALMKMYSACSYEKTLNVNQTSTASYHVFVFKATARRSGRVGKKKKGKKTASFLRVMSNAHAIKNSKFTTLQSTGVTFSVSGIPLTGTAADSKCQQRVGTNTQDAGVTYTAATTQCTFSTFGLDNPIILTKSSAPAVQGLPQNVTLTLPTVSFKAGTSLAMSWTLLVLVLALAFLASSF